MTTCEKHDCELKPLFTSSYCPRCDEEAAVNVDLDMLMKHIYSHDSDGKELHFGNPHPTYNVGWYHGCPVVDSDQQVREVAPLRKFKPTRRLGQS